MKIKDLPDDVDLGTVWFKHPDTGEKCLWYSQWGYEKGAAGIFYKKDVKSTQMFTLHLKNLKEALKLEVIA